MLNRSGTRLMTMTMVSLLTATLLAVFLGTEVEAEDRCVAPGGAQGCFATVQEGVDAANDGDTVRVVAGIYSENIVVDKSIVLRGGCTDATCSERVPRVSILDGGQANSVIQIVGGANATVDGFTIRNGDATSNGGLGGGIYISEAAATILDNDIQRNVASRDPAINGLGGGIYAAAGTDEIIITGNSIMRNVAYSVSIEGPPIEGRGYGGGVWLANDTNGVISENSVMFNTAAQTNPAVKTTQGFGGGVGGSGDTIVIDDNLISVNVANSAGRRGFGGAINIFNTRAVTIVNNQLTENIALTAGSDASGGAIYVGLFSERPDGVVLIQGNQMLNNTAAMTVTPDFDLDPPMFAGGGAVRAWGSNLENTTLIIEDNEVRNNKVVRLLTNLAGIRAEGGAMSVGGFTNLHIDTNEICFNVVADVAGTSGSAQWGGGLGGGGMALSDSSHIVVNRNEVCNNRIVGQFSVADVDAVVEGGGIAVSNSNAVTMTNNRIQANYGALTAGIAGGSGRNLWISGGGISLYCNNELECAASISDNEIRENVGAQQASSSGANAKMHPEGGGIRAVQIDVTEIMSNVIADNVAVDQMTLTGNGTGQWGGRPSGGGVYVHQSRVIAITDNRIHLNIAARSQSATGINTFSEGGGLVVSDGQSAEIIDNVISENITMDAATLSGSNDETFYSNGGGIALSCHIGSDCPFLLRGNDIIANVNANTLTLLDDNVNGAAQGAAIGINPRTNVTLTQNRILANVTSPNGGFVPVIWIWKGKVTSTNNIYAANTRAIGVGTDNEPVELTSTNDTYHNNGISALSANATAGFLNVRNSILTGHLFGIELQNPGISVTSDYNLLTNDTNYQGDIQPGAHDIQDADPLFADPATYNFHIGPGSPALDAGTNTDAPPVDHEGDTRPLDGNRDGIAVTDIGADEYQGYPVFLPLAR